MSLKSYIGINKGLYKRANKAERTASRLSEKYESKQKLSNIVEQIFEKYSYLNPNEKTSSQAYKKEPVKQAQKAYAKPAELTDEKPKKEQQKPLEYRAENTPKEKEAEKTETPASEDYLTSEEIAKLPGVNPLSSIQRKLDDLVKINPELTKHESKVKKGNRRVWYKNCNTLYQYALKEYSKEKAEDLIKNARKYIKEHEDESLGEIIKKIENHQEELFLPFDQITKLPGIKGSAVVSKTIADRVKKDANYTKKGERTGTHGPKTISYYKLTPELANEIFEDGTAKTQILEALKKKQKTKTEVLDKEDKIKEQVESELERLTDEEFFAGTSATVLKDENEINHTNALLITKKVKKDGKEYEIKYAFKPTEKQKQDITIGRKKIGKNKYEYETISQIDQTINDISASIVNDELGFELVEKTSIRTHPEEGKGSIRKLIDPFISRSEITRMALESGEDIVTQLKDDEINERLAFRYIINETDPSFSNWGVQLRKDGVKKVKFIDVSQSFGMLMTYNPLESIKKTPQLIEKIMKVDEEKLKEKLKKATENQDHDFSEQIEDLIERIQKLKEYLERE